MKLKSYFADSMQAAMDKARTELGPDAMLISSRQTDAELRDIGAYEVVFGVSPAETSNVVAMPSPGETMRKSSPAASEIVLRELAELKQQVASFRHSVTRSHMVRGNQPLSPELSAILDQLTGAGFSADLAQELTNAVALHGSPQTVGDSHRMIRGHRDLFARDLLQAVLDEEIRARFKTAPSLGADGETAPAVMLVGPPGAGKTTSLVKLAFNYGLKKRRPFQFVSVDTSRVGAWDQLSAYARISGAAFKGLHDLSELPSALGGRGLTLIDTPGFAKAEEAEAEMLAETINDLPIEVHLVIPAYASLAMARQLWSRFAKFQPAKLLLTHTDVLEGTAVAVEFAIESGLPLSFLASGQQVPEDIEPADHGEIAARVLSKRRSLSIAA